MATLPSPFDLPEHATLDDLRSRLRVMADIIVRAPVPIAIAHDAECRFISANDALAALLGVPAGTNISLTPPPGETAGYRIQREGRDVAVPELPMQYAIAHRQRVTSDIEIVRADGSLLYVRNDVEPVYDAGGAVCGCISVCVDTTAHRQVESMLREAARLKDEFLATLSHELRNPLAPIRNAIELMRRAGDDPALNARALEITERQFQQLVRLTDDLLDVSRISRNRIELRRARIDLRTVLESAIEATEPLIQAAGHHITVTLPPQPLWVDADFTRIAQSFSNLLNNAVKYTDRGGRIAVAADSDDDGVVVTVTDSGIGIAPEQLPRIFDMFMQVEHGMERAQSGLGIGLTLARRLIELHGGRIEASSAGRGTGTTFSVRLPHGPAAAVTTSAPEPRARTAARRRVLVAEDIPDAAEMMRLMIEHLGHDVRVAADGVQAVALAREFEPDVALLDIGMPRMDGYEAARQIRAALGARVRLVALTGWGQPEDQRRAEEAGFDKHLTKPAEPGQLEELIG